MNFALIFAGGIGQRMNTISLPKQFLRVHGTPIIIHTLLHFQKCDKIDGIVVVCLNDFIDYMEQLKNEYNIDKIIEIVPGGETGQASIFNGLVTLKKYSKSNKDIVLIHDGVRPLINDQVIVDNIKCVIENGTSITVAKSTETILVLDSDKVEDVVDRNKCFMGRAPQSFFLDDIYCCHLKAKKLNRNDFIDSAMLMHFFGYKMFTVLGPAYNIKITTPMDFYMFKAILDEKEYEQIKVIE